MNKRTHKLTPAGERVQKAIDALRTPDASLARCPNTVRQSIADLIEELERVVDKYGVALLMIREGCDDPETIAADTLRKFIDRTLAASDVEHLKGR